MGCLKKIRNNFVPDCGPSCASIIILQQLIAYKLFRNVWKQEKGKPSERASARTREEGLVTDDGSESCCQSVFNFFDGVFSFGVLTIGSFSIAAGFFIEFF